MRLMGLAAFEGGEVGKGKACLSKPFPVALKFIDSFPDQEASPVGTSNVCPVLDEVVLDGPLSQLFLYQRVESQCSEPRTATLRCRQLELVYGGDGPVALFGK